MLGVVKLVPVPREVPPVAALNHSIVSPAPAVAERVTVPVPHLEKGPAPAAGAAGAELIVAVIEVLVADTQPPAVVLASAK